MFMNPSRVTNADIDTDYAGEDRDRVKEFLLRDRLNLPTIRSAEIITFNTIAIKGAVRDVCRALYKDRDYMTITNLVSKLLDSNEEDARKAYPEVFEYADIVNGTIVSIGTHPSGVLISDLPIEETIGLCSVGTSEYPVTMINMKELDDQMYVKLDALGLDNIGIINETCRLLGIERLNPDNVDLNDMDVWKSIRNDTTLIFQWESQSAGVYLKQFMSDKTLAIAKERVPNFSMIKWLSFGNGLIRPACASFRDSVARGEFYDNGFDALNEFLAPEAGRIAMQETIMQFLVKFCGYSAAESDTVRRGIAKKKGTEQLLPEIEERFIKNCTKEYAMTEDECRNIIKPFLQVILDASSYAFSWNHSDSYSLIGYICGYLRYYYPLEFLTASLNIFDDNMDKTAEITKYAGKVGITVTMPKWGISKSKYRYDKEKNVITKGMKAIKFLNERVANELYDLAKANTYTHFVDVLEDIQEKTSLNRRQLEILIRIDFFSDFGTQRELLYITDMYLDLFNRGNAKKIAKTKLDNTPYTEIVNKYAVDVTKNGGISQLYTLLDVKRIVIECEDLIKTSNLGDLDIVTKARNFEEAMGYPGYVSGRPEDKRFLFITDLHALHRKRDGKLFGYSINTKSIGSGKESRFTVFNKIYNNLPINKGDIIFCKGFERDGIYFKLTAYDKVQ